MITQERLKELIEYNENTGLITQKERTSKDISRASRLKSWNTRFAGKPCLCVSKSNGYIVVRLDGKLHLAHRLAFLYAYGTSPEYIDHINGDKLDNRIENLRASSKLHNPRNRKIGKRNKSGCHGVYKDGDVYRVQLWSYGSYYGGGTFSSLGDAIAKRKEMEAEHGFPVEHGTR